MAAGPHRLLEDGVDSHQSVVISDRLFIWAGLRPDGPEVHDSPEKLNWSSSIDILDISSRQWSSERTTGQPPLGIWGYSCTAINDKIYYFGGYCGHGSCYHNSLAALDTSNKRWDMLSGTDDGLPVMRRGWGGLISVNNKILLSIGGRSSSQPTTPHPQSSYSDSYGNIRTNEMNLFNLSTREWSIPSSTGQCMPPTDEFTIENISESQAIIFGGDTSQGNTNSLYIIQITVDEELATTTVHWQNIRPSMLTGEWPERRYAHASTIINQNVLVVMGGYDIGDDELCWLFNISERSWTKIDMSGYIEGRYYHSLSSLMSGDNCALLIVVGGNDSNNYDYVTLEDFYRVIKLRMTNDEWAVDDGTDNEPLNEELQGMTNDEWAVDDGTDNEPNEELQAPEKVQFNIEHVNEEQVFEKPQHGVKLVIPPSSVPDHQPIDTTIQPVPTDTFTLPPDVQPVSCFYEFGTSGSFTKSIQLHIQHNVHLSSAEDTSRLAFVIGNGSPPYQFELCEDDQQMRFAPRDNAGVISVSHFSTHIFGIVWKVIDKIFPPKVYTIYPFYKQMDTTCWHVKVFITENLSTFLEMILKNMNGWAKIDPDAFKFESNTIVLRSEANQTFDIKALKPLEVDKDEVDQCQPNSSAFPHMHVEAKLKKDYILTDLKFEFNGTVKEKFFMITEGGLSTKSSVNVMPKGVELLNDHSGLLDMKPKKSHLMTILDSIRYQWREIGIQLEIKNVELECIRYDPALSCTGKLSGVLQLWIDGKTTANDGSWKVSWKKILDVVKTPPIENNEVHDEMIEFLSRPDIQQEYLSSGADYHNNTTFRGLPMITDDEAGTPAVPPAGTSQNSPSSQDTCCKCCTVC